ncbi:hypothetical protein AAFF_G00074560 [Aldrovandia affinis]|uniref:Secreted protein n=1 Tax=Aldrovandia affinis TaxID=143900 RepID=A0AAD7WDD1_9TELE|nr:hypothetical protein AAFF_G00074560 [Aldrovandia affinis]
MVMENVFLWAGAFCIWWLPCPKSEARSRRDALLSTFPCRVGRSALVCGVPRAPRASHSPQTDCNSLGATKDAD